MFVPLQIANGGLHGLIGTPVPKGVWRGDQGSAGCPGDGSGGAASSSRESLLLMLPGREFEEMLG